MKQFWTWTPWGFVGLESREAREVTETENVMAEMLAIAEDRWDEYPETKLGETLTRSVKKWHALILQLQRLHVAVILDRLHVPARMAIFLAWRLPWRLLPRFDPDKWRAERSDQ